MSKYTKEFKIKLILEYLSGDHVGQGVIAKKYQIPESTVRNWIYRYQDQGLESIDQKLNYATYTSEFKLSVIQYRQTNKCSYREAAQHFGLSNGSMVYAWTKKYREEGLLGLETKKGRPGKDMSKQDQNTKLNAPLKESEREELLRLREENRLLRMKEAYTKKLSALLLKEEAEARQKHK